MKSKLTTKLLLLAFSTAIISCSVNEDDQIASKKKVETISEQLIKTGDTTFVEGEPVIPKPR